MLNLWVIGISLMPRLLTPFAFKSGTIYILFFWMPWLVCFQEFIKDRESKKLEVNSLPNLTKVLLIISASIVLLAMIYRNVIYSDVTEGAIANLRRMLYFLNPLICLSWYPLIKLEKRNQFWKLLIFLTAFLGTAVCMESLLLDTFISSALNHYTAEVSAFLLGAFSDDLIMVTNNLFGNKNFSIEVHWGCSSIPDMLISLNCLFVFYMCSKLKSTLKMLIVVILSLTIAFLLNSIRISILGYFSLNQKNNMFEFWHDGLGSLIFTFIIVTFVCLTYYVPWVRENPEADNKIGKDNS